VQHLVKTNIPPAADIWALGAVFSDVLVWSTLGETGRENYRLKRQAEISLQRQLREREIDACFHNGEERLKAVDKFHSLALQYRRQRDDVSPHMSNLILESMLIDCRERRTAMQIRLHADRKLKNIQDGSLERSHFSSGQDSTWALIDALDSAAGPLSLDGAQIPPLERRKTVPARLLDLGAPRPLYDTQAGIHYTTTHRPFPNGSTGFAELPAPSILQEQLSSLSASGGIDEKVTVDKVYSLMEKAGRTSLLSSLGSKSDKSTTIMSLRGMEEARRKILAHKGRDQVSGEKLSYFSY
jgi:hypothetical protein